MKGAELLVKILERYGVSHIFGLPGDATPFFRALSKSKIKFITMRDERGAGFAADVYGRLSGQPGVLYVSRGPGGTNAVSGIASSFLDASPLLVITDQVGRKYLARRTQMCVELEKTFVSVSKGAELVWRAQDIPDAVARAWSDMQTHPRGPRCLVIPQDVFNEESAYRHVAPKHLKIKDESIKAASRFIHHFKRSKNPVAILGPGVLEYSSTKEFISFVDQFPMRYFSTRNAKGALPLNHPLNFGVMAGWNDFLSGTDLVVTVGFDTAEKPFPYAWIKNRKIRHLDISHHPHTKLSWFSPQEIYTVDLKHFFSDIARRSLQLNIPPVSLGNAAQWRERVRKETYEYFGGKLLYRFLGEEFLGSALSAKDILLPDTGIHKALVLFCYEAPGPIVVPSIGFSSIGFAIPGALGASLAKSKARVVVVCGDGGFLQSAAELETIRRLKLPVKIIMVADSSYGLIKTMQMRSFKAHVGTDFTNPDFKYLARAFGFKYVPVRRENDLKKARAEILLRTRPSLIVLYEKYRYR